MVGTISLRGVIMIYIKMITLLYVLLYTLSASAVVPKVKTIAEPKRIFFIGNSFSYYNDGLHNHLGNLLRSAGRYVSGETRLRLMTISGGKLAEHAGGLSTMVQPSKWDVVVMQGHSAATLEKKSAQSFAQAVREFSAYIRKAGSEPVLFMTWAYQNKPAMILPISRRYQILANEIDALVVPVGIAFHMVGEQYSQINLYSKDIRQFTEEETSQTTIIYKKDIKHPSEAGTYLAACVFYATLFQSSPQGLSYIASLNIEEARILQHVATQVVGQFYERTAD